MANPCVVLASFAPDLPEPIAGIQLRPVKVITSLLLERIGSPLVNASIGKKTTPADPLDAVRAVYLMSRSDDELLEYVNGFSMSCFEANVQQFARRTPATAIHQLVAVMLDLLQFSTATVIGAADDQPEQDGKEKTPWDNIRAGDGKPNGLGWVLTLVDTLAHEYGWTIERCLLTQQARAFALWSAIQARYGVEPKGPTYEETEELARLDREMAEQQSGRRRKRKGNCGR